MQFSLDSPDSLLANFFSSATPAELVFITGPSGAGKTRWCQELVRLASAHGVQVCGLLSPAVIVRASKVAIELLDIATGRKTRLAARRRPSASDNSKPGILTQDWRFNPKALAWGNHILASLPESIPLLILDELGPLEFLQNQGFTKAMDLISRRGYRLACVVVRPELLSQALQRWPWGRPLLLKTGTGQVGIA